MNKESKGIKIFGGILVMIGVIIALDQFDVLEYLGIYNFSLWRLIGLCFEAMFDLWPALLIAAGFALIFKSRTARRIIAIVLVVVIASYMVLGPVLGIFYFQHGSSSVRVENLDDPWDDDSSTEEVKISNEPMDPTEEWIPIESSVNMGDLELDLRNCELYMSSQEQEGVMFKHSWPQIAFSTQTENGRMNIDIEDDSFASKEGAKRGSLVLSQRIPWDISLDTGAAVSNLNLTDLEVRELDIDTGTGMLQMYLGNKGVHTNVNIDGGVSAVELTVSADSGIRVYCDGGLSVSANNFEEAGLKEVGRNTYESDNYQSAAHKINLELDLGVGDIHLVRQ